MNNAFVNTDRVVQNLQNILQTEKEAIWTSNPHLSPEALQHLWYQRRNQLAAYFNIHDGLSQEIQMSIVPRTMPRTGHPVVRQASVPDHALNYQARPFLITLRLLDTRTFLNRLLV